MSSESIANPSKTVSMDNGSGSGESLGHSRKRCKRISWDISAKKFVIISDSGSSSIAEKTTTTKIKNMNDK